MVPHLANDGIGCWFVGECCCSRYGLVGWWLHTRFMARQRCSHEYVWLVSRTILVFFGDMPGVLDDFNDRLRWVAVCCPMMEPSSRWSTTTKAWSSDESLGAWRPSWSNGKSNIQTIDSLDGSGKPDRCWSTSDQKRSTPTSSKRRKRNRSSTYGVSNHSTNSMLKRRMLFSSGRWLLRTNHC